MDNCGTRMNATMLHDLRSAIRGLRRRPLTSAITVTIMALGLGASVAVFTYINGFAQPFPGADPDGLMLLHGIEEDNPYTFVSYLDYLDYQSEGGRVFEDVSAVESRNAASIRHETSTEVVFLEAVSGNYLEVLEVDMAAGRRLAPSDDVPGAEPVAVISYAWWQRQWGGDPSIIGTVVNFNFRPHTVVGVVGPEFRGSRASWNPDAWLPFEPFRARYGTQASENRDLPLVRVHARLRDGVSAAEALGEVERITAGLDEVYPRARGERRRAGLARASWIEPSARVAEADTLRIMIAAAVGLLLLVCANVGNLLLAIATGRDQEMAMRAAVGASRTQLVRQVIAENVVLAGVAGVVAVLMASPASARLGSYFARPSVWGADVAREVTVDMRVIGFAVVVSLVTSLIAGLLPALSVYRRDLNRLLTERVGRPGVRRVLGRRAPDIRESLVAAQVGLAVVLVVLAGLVLRSLESAVSIDPGFDYEHLMASHISTSSTGVQVPERDEWFREIARRLGEEPWVRSATISNAALLSPHATAEFAFEGFPEDARMVASAVIPGFFSTVGIALVEGRTFARSDTLGAPNVAIVNEAVAARFFAQGSAVGRTVRVVGAGGTAYEVVGVVEDARVRDFLTEPEPVVYLSNPQQAYGSGSALTVATVDEPRLAVARMRQWLLEYEPHLAIVSVLPYSEVARGFTYTQRMNAELFSLLAALALGLAALGIFSVMSLAVTRRRREIGVRMAIGARSGDIGRMVMGRVLGSIGLGLVGGLLGGLVLARFARNLLLGVEPGDPSNMITAAVVLVTAGLAAAALPAYRATSVDPIRSLRTE